MAKAKKKKKAVAPVSAPRKKLPLRGLGKLLILIFGSAAAYGLYRFANTRGFTAAFWIYGGVLLAAGLAYVIANRGFTRDSLTADDLPEDWDAEKKNAFLAERDNRKKKSAWLLLIVFPVAVSLFLDWFELFALDWLLAALKGT